MKQRIRVSAKTYQQQLPPPRKNAVPFPARFHRQAAPSESDT